jgi:hypothetical protein
MIAYKKNPNVFVLIVCIEKCSPYPERQGLWARSSKPLYDYFDSCILEENIFVCASLFMDLGEKPSNFTAGDLAGFHKTLTNLTAKIQTYTENKIEDLNQSFTDPILLVHWVGHGLQKKTFGNLDRLLIYGDSEKNQNNTFDQPKLDLHDFLIFLRRNEFDPHKRIRPDDDYAVSLPRKQLFFIHACAQSGATESLVNCFLLDTDFKGSEATDARQHCFLSCKPGELTDDGEGTFSQNLKLTLEKLDSDSQRQAASAGEPNLNYGSFLQRLVEVNNDDFSALVEYQLLEEFRKIDDAIMHDRDLQNYSSILPVNSPKDFTKIDKRYLSTRNEKRTFLDATSSFDAINSGLYVSRKRVEKDIKDKINDLLRDTSRLDRISIVNLYNIKSSGKKTVAFWLMRDLAESQRKGGLYYMSTPNLSSESISDSLIDFASSQKSIGPHIILVEGSWDSDYWEEAIKCAFRTLTFKIILIFTSRTRIERSDLGLGDGAVRNIEIPVWDQAEAKKLIELSISRDHAPDCGWPDDCINMLGRRPDRLFHPIIDAKSKEFCPREVKQLVINYMYKNSDNSILKEKLDEVYTPKILLKLAKKQFNRQGDEKDKDPAHLDLFLRVAFFSQYEIFLPKEILYILDEYKGEEIWEHFLQYNQDFFGRTEVSCKPSVVFWYHTKTTFEARFSLAVLSKPSQIENILNDGRYKGTTIRIQTQDYVSTNSIEKVISHIRDRGKLFFSSSLMIDWVIITLSQFIKYGKTEYVNRIIEVLFSEEKSFSSIDLVDLWQKASTKQKIQIYNVISQLEHQQKKRRWCTGKILNELEKEDVEAQDRFYLLRFLSRELKKPYKVSIFTGRDHKITYVQRQMHSLDTLLQERQSDSQLYLLCYEYLDFIRDFSVFLAYSDKQEFETQLIKHIEQLFKQKVPHRKFYNLLVLYMDYICTRTKDRKENKKFVFEQAKRYLKSVSENVYARDNDLAYTQGYLWPIYIKHLMLYSVNNQELQAAIDSAGMFIELSNQDFPDFSIMSHYLRLVRTQLEITPDLDPKKLGFARKVIAFYWNYMCDRRDLTVHTMNTVYVVFWVAFFELLREYTFASIKICCANPESIEHDFLLHDVNVICNIAGKTVGPRKDSDLDIMQNFHVWLANMKELDDQNNIRKVRYAFYSDFSIELLKKVDDIEGNTSLSLELLKQELNAQCKQLILGETKNWTCLEGAPFPRENSLAILKYYSHLITEDNMQSGSVQSVQDFTSVLLEAFSSVVKDLKDDNITGKSERNRSNLKFLNLLLAEHQVFLHRSFPLEDSRIFLNYCSNRVKTYLLFRTIRTEIEKETCRWMIAEKLDPDNSPPKDLENPSGGGLSTSASSLEEALPIMKPYIDNNSYLKLWCSRQGKKLYDVIMDIDIQQDSRRDWKDLLISIKCLRQITAENTYKYTPSEIRIISSQSYSALIFLSDEVQKAYRLYGDYKMIGDEILELREEYGVASSLNW